MYFSSLNPWPAPACVLRTEISLTQTFREACRELLFPTLASVSGRQRRRGMGFEIQVCWAVCVPSVFFGLGWRWLELSRCFLCLGNRGLEEGHTEALLWQEPLMSMGAL